MVLGTYIGEMLLRVANVDSGAPDCVFSHRNWYTNIPQSD